MCLGRQALQKPNNQPHLNPGWNVAFSGKTHNAQIDILSDLSGKKTLVLRSRSLQSGVCFHKIPKDLFWSLEQNNLPLNWLVALINLIGSTDHGDLHSIYTVCFHKNVIYKNIEAESCRKFKNIIRMFRGLNSNQHQNLFLYLYK